jgi:hypothetical protein
MAWGSKITATQLTSIATEQVFDQAPTLNPRESAHCRVEVDFPDERGSCPSSINHLTSARRPQPNPSPVSADPRKACPRPRSSWHR